MNCKDWEERIALHVGGDLPAAEAAEVERHLAACDGCREAAAAFGRGLELLREAHQEPLEPAPFTAVRARVLAQLELKRRPLWAYGLVAAAVMLLVLLALRPGRAPRPQVMLVMPPPPPPKEMPVIVGQGRALPGRVKRAGRGPAQQPLLVKLVTDDPNVVIYWIAD